MEPLPPLIWEQCSEALEKTSVKNKLETLQMSMTETVCSNARFYDLGTHTHTQPNVFFSRAGSGRLNFATFYRIVQQNEPMRRPDTPGEVEAYFRVFDIYGDGRVSLKSIIPPFRPNNCRIGFRHHNSCGFGSFAS